jgi:ATP-dependent Clp protease ATP-binding subunit ClpC
MNKYTEELRRILKLSEIEAIENDDPLVGSEHVLLSTLKTKNSLTESFNNLNITYDKVKEHIQKGNNKIDFAFYQSELLKIIDDIISKKQDIEEEISLASLITSILENTSTNAYKILKKLNIDIEKLKETLKTKEVETQTLTIKELATNLNEEAKQNNLDKVIGRDKEIERIIEILARKNKNNPILIGEAGVGKTAIVEELARKIVNGEVPKFLQNKEILNLNIANVIAGTKYRGEFEEKLSKIIKELESVDNLILFIDEIHTIVGAGGAEGAIDASNILKPALARGKIKCIGATTNAEFKATIEKDKALERRFQKVYIKEPNEEETKNILKKIKKDYEKYHDVIIPENILDLTIKLSRKYITDRNEPDKSIDILDEICASTSIKEKKNDYMITKNKINKLLTQKNKYILKNDFQNASKIKKEINSLKIKLEKYENKNTKNKVTKEILKKVLETKTNSTIYELSDKSYLTDLNNKLKAIVINQNKQIDELTTITGTHMTKDNNLPTSILLKGTEGTGKTYLIENYKKALNLNLIKVNLDEYTNDLSINKIIGSPAGYVGYDQKNTIFESIKNFPISIILLENYEYAHPNITNLINNTLETGTLKLSNNEILNFKNALFIFTTNNIEQKNSVGFINENHITKENKYNHTITLNKLTKDDITTIIKKENQNLSENDITKIIENSDYKNKGAKKIKSLINEILAKQIVKL